MKCNKLSAVVPSDPRRPRRVPLSLQGLADTFILLGLPFDSPEAKLLNSEIFEAIYYAGLKTSCQLAAKDGAA